MINIKAVCFAVLLVFSVPAEAGLTPDAGPQDVLKALTSARVSELEQYYSNIAHKQKANDSDYAQFNAYQVFVNPDPGLSQPLDQWVSQFSDSPYALTARGLHYYAIAMQYRGRKSTPDTSAAEIESMQKYMEQARSDLSAAMKDGLGFTIPVAALITVYKVLGKRESLEKLAREGLNIYPGSYAIRYAYLDSHIPKWGGTFENLVAFLDDTVGQTSLNPDLKYLHGFGYSIIADGYSKNRDYDKATNFAVEAAKQGLNDREFLRIAQIFFDAGKYEEADQYLDRALSLYPARVASLYWKGRVAERISDNGQADEWYQRALAVNPVDTATLRTQARLLLKRGDHSAAETNYSRAIENYGTEDTAVIDDYLLMLVSSSKKYHSASKLAEQSWPLFKDSHRLFWYSYGIALAGLKDCKTVAAMKRYQQNCKGIANRCDASALQSAEKQIRAVVDPGTCEDVAAFSVE